MEEQSDEEKTFLESQAAYMQGWQYGNRLYRERNDDAAWLMREALRRAVDIRDKRAGMSLGARPVMLVDVLNALCTALGHDVNAPLWSDWDR
jgi:hypothetical protein